MMDWNVPDEIAFEELIRGKSAKEVADILLAYIEAGQPDEFLPEYSTRAMGDLAARLTGVGDYLDYYFYMWSGGKGEFCKGEFFNET